MLAALRCLVHSSNSSRLPDLTQSVKLNNFSAERVKTTISNQHLASDAKYATQSKLLCEFLTSTVFGYWELINLSLIHSVFELGWTYIYTQAISKVKHACNTKEITLSSWRPPR